MSRSLRTQPDVSRIETFLRTQAGLGPLPCEGFPGNPIFRELPLLELEFRLLPRPRSLSQKAIDYSLGLLRETKDCQDFVMQAVLRILFRYEDSFQISENSRGKMRQLMRDAVYARDDTDRNLAVVFQTENHQIMYGTAEYLFGQRFPTQTLGVTGRPGSWHAARARENLLRWMEWRAKVGFTEWLSSCYYDETISALLNLFDFADDPALVARAQDLLDTLFLEMALHFWREQPTGSQGRVYENQLLAPACSPMAILANLCWGEIAPAHEGTCRAATLLASSSYRLPNAIVEIGRERADAVVVRQRNSVNVEDAAALGIDPADAKNLPFFLSMGQNLHHLVATTAFHADARGNGYHAAHDYYETRRKEGGPFDGDPAYTALTQADIYTFKTPDFALGCIQSYRPGKPGFQQHTWTATLGTEAVVFTTNPAFGTPWGRPGRWHGNGILPRVLQHRNVLIAMHRVAPYPILDQAPWYFAEFTHAYFPREAFDETHEQNGWCFGRKQNAYIALRPSAAAAWIPEEDGRIIEWRVSGRECAWVCELGSAATTGSFARFAEAIAAADWEVSVDQVRYDSPSLGLIETGWSQSFRVAGSLIPIGDHPRFESPWVNAPFGCRQYEIHSGTNRHTIDFDSGAWHSGT